MATNNERVGQRVGQCVGQHVGQCIPNSYEVIPTKELDDPISVTEPEGLEDRDTRHSRTAIAKEMRNRTTVRPNIEILKDMFEEDLDYNEHRVWW